ncbi:MAG: transglutaminase domain-containing protein, partial [Oscillochloris sp.]|nr:transglutaminase domain-containing protein [Oscillochloris sp.]
ERAPLPDAASAADPPDYRPSLALPPDLPPRVADLARSVTADIADPHKQALAIEQYLRELPYAYEVQPIPAGGDAVDQFLFEMRQGYCTYYASAMAVMARSLGIPARLALGYATGSYDEARGVYLVYEADAHAWPELLIDGRWLAFEPTPVRPLPTRTLADPPPAPVIIPQSEPVAPAQGWELDRALIWFVAGVCAILLPAAAWWFRHAARRSPLAQAQWQLERFGDRAGVLWPPGLTVHEYGQLLIARGLATSAAMDELIALIEQGRYSDQPLSTIQQQQLRAGMRALRNLRRL